MVGRSPSSDGRRIAACVRNPRAKPSNKEKNIPMAATLQEILLAPDTQPKVIADCYTLVEQGVAEKSGVSGTAVKLAYKTVNTFLPGHIRYMAESLLPEMVDKLEPYWADFNSSGGTEFGDYLAKRGRGGVAGPAVGDRRPRGGLWPAHGHQGVRHRPRQSSQARRGRAPARRRPGAEVRALTISRSPARPGFRPAAASLGLSGTSPPRPGRDHLSSGANRREFLPLMPKVVRSLRRIRMPVSA